MVELFNLHSLFDSDIRTMNLVKVILFAAFVSVSGFLMAQNAIPPSAGASGLAMGYTGVTFENIYSAFSNQAGLARLSEISFAVQAEQRFLAAGINSGSAAFAYPTKSGTFGLAINYFGFSVYNEQKIGLSYSRLLDKNLTIGAQVDYVGLRFQDAEYGNRGTVTFEIGMQAKLLKKFTIGAHVFSPVRIKLTENPEDVIPTQFNLGVSYEPSKKVTVNVEVEKDIDFPVSFKAGVEYFPVEKFGVRAGTSTMPTQNSFGFGIRLDQVEIDLGTVFNWDLGFTPGISIAYSIPSKENTKKASSTKNKSQSR